MSDKILSNDDDRNIIHSKKNLHDYDGETKIFGFWIYLMSDCVLFATLFATYAVLNHATDNGPSSKDIFELPFVLLETFVLLFSSISYGIAFTFSKNYDNKSFVNNWLALTFILGIIFINMECYEFYHLIKKGYGPNCSAFLSSFFTLVATHGIHVIVGLIWILVMIVQISYQGLTIINQTRLQCLSLFWHFLDIIWICVFTIVYLMGILS